ncbi:MAG: BREX-1 system adenine-specific DNA-methyltransferase PglX [Oscillospiraceae bacterium]|nr:BREX-1 system adenine-specific DNA-methyltransferase PglX [Oscillospiraceae bacterium]
MDKSRIKNFATNARRSLIDQITQKAFEIGVLNDKAVQVNEVTDGFIYKDITYGKSELSQRQQLIKMIKLRADGNDYKYGYKLIMEEVAYTWFNRFIALRFMEVNDYLPSGIRILSSLHEGKMEPDVISEVYSLDYIDFNEVELLQNDTEKLYKYILISQCNALSKIMPKMFQKIADYTEILLPDKLYTKGGIVYDLINGISEKDFKEQVEIIGWLYQYYISEKKDEVFANLKKNIKISKENIPAATQLFTPDWIVKYMVENSLGRLWIENSKDKSIKEHFKYYLDEAEQTEEVRRQLDEMRIKDLKPEDIKIIDPCMGSGHILVYAFDVFYMIYESLGYSQRDIPKLILENNIYGLDIDERAGQLAYFALMMRGRKYNRRFFRDKVEANVYSFEETDGIKKDHFRFMGSNISDKALWYKLYGDFCYVVDLFVDAKEFGSILKFDRELDVEKLALFVKNDSSGDQISDETLGIEESKEWLIRILDIVRVMMQKYDVVVTNPPYMGNGGMNAKLSDYLKKKYLSTKYDLGVVFIEKCGEFLKNNAYQAMITQHSFMFLSSFEKFREQLFKKNLINMAHLGARAFEEIGGEVVQTASFVFRNNDVENYKSLYVRLVDYIGQKTKEDAFLSGENRYFAIKENFAKIPGMPVAYWVNNKIFCLFINDNLDHFADIVKGLDTCDNALFVKDWFEVKQLKVSFKEYSIENKFKWYPYCKGGDYRKWYGNLEKVVLWENNGAILRNLRSENGKIKSRPQNIRFYFKTGLTWSTVSGYKVSMRYMENTIFGGGGSGLFCKIKNFNYLFAFLNSEVALFLLNILNPTLNILVGDIKNLPIIIDEKYTIDVDKIVNQNISISKLDWDAFETSWDFINHPLTIEYELNVNAIIAKWDTKVKIHCTIEDQFNLWTEFTTEQFAKLKSNEEELNRIFIEIYGLQDELTPEVADKDVTIRKADLTRDIKSLISYSVGCMFGRYSLDTNGLVYAGGDFDITKYKSFIPDEDNIIPITEEEYFDDDILVRFTEFIRKCFGEETLDENLEFIAKALYPNSTATPRQSIRKYFLSDFYKDHIKVYQKKPIYWQFESGKHNGFKALIYLHRYDKYTVARVRTDYLHSIQRSYESEIKRMDMLSNLSTTGVKDKATFKKSIEALQKKIDELRSYDQAIAHIANQSIDLDLDDGVTVNYSKFQNIEVIQSGGKGNIKIDLLGKI